MSIRGPHKSDITTHMSQPIFNSFKNHMTRLHMFIFHEENEFGV